MNKLFIQILVYLHICKFILIQKLNFLLCAKTLFLKESQTTYYKKGIEMYTNKKKFSIKPLFFQSKNMTGNSSSIYLELKKMQYTTLCRVGTRRPLYLQYQAIIGKRVRRRALIPPRTHTQPVNHHFRYRWTSSLSLSCGK